MADQATLHTGDRAPRVAMAVSNRYDPDPRVQKEARSLVRAGCEVTVFAYDREGDMDTAEEVLDGVRIVRLRSRASRYGGLLSTWLGLRSFRRDVLARLGELAPDVVHCHDQDTCAIGSKWRRRHGIPWVFDAHDLYWSWILMPDPNSALRRIGAQLLKSRDRRYARSCDLLLTSSAGRGGFPGFDTHYRELGADPVVILNVPDHERDGGVVAMPPRFTVGYLGNVREPEMFRTLIEAVLLLPAERRPLIRIAGGGSREEEVSGMFERAASEHGLDVEVSSRFSMEQNAGLHAECSLQYCVYPTERGNIPQGALATKMFEAVLFGRKVLVNAGCLMQAWVEESGWGWAVEPGDVRGLARVLELASEELAEHPVAPLPAPPPWSSQAELLIAAYRKLLAL